MITKDEQAAMLALLRIVGRRAALNYLAERNAARVVNGEKHALPLR